MPQKIRSGTYPVHSGGSPGVVCIIFFISVIINLEMEIVHGTLLGWSRRMLLCKNATITRVASARPKWKFYSLS